MATPIPKNDARFSLAEIAAATAGRLIGGSAEPSAGSFIEAPEELVEQPAAMNRSRPPRSALRDLLGPRRGFISSPVVAR